MLKGQEQAFGQKNCGLLAGFVDWEELLDNNVNQGKHELHH